METLQLILVYITVTIAFGYIMKKFFLPKSFFVSKKVGLAAGQAGTKACGQNDCGCH